VAIGINPFDVTGTAAAMARGLSMSRAEREDRAAELPAPSTVPHPVTGWLSYDASRRFPPTGIWVPGVGRIFRACKVELPNDQEADCSARPVEDEVGRVDKASGASAPATAIFTVWTPEMP